MTYPSWICLPCGVKRGRMPPGHVFTQHDPDPKDPNDMCGWCETKARPLTEPRDFGYPPAPKKFPKVVPLRSKESL